jgi:two-component system sensor histidine kinase QseC
MTLAPHSLQRRLLVLVLSVVTAVWLATAALTWMDVRHELDELLDGHLAQAAAILVVQQGQDMDGDHDSIDAPSLHPYAPRVAFQVFHEGRLAMRSTNAPQRAMAGDDNDFRSGFETVQIEGVPWRVFSTYGAEHDVHVYVGEETESRSQILLAVLRSTLLPIAIALPLLAAALWWAINRSLEPMRRLGVTLSQRAPMVLTPLALDGSPTCSNPNAGLRQMPHTSCEHPLRPYGPKHRWHWVKRMTLCAATRCATLWKVATERSVLWISC